MAQVKDLIVTGASRLLSKLYVSDAVTAPTFIGKLQGNADTATALTTSAGSTTQPVYFSGGKPAAITGTLSNSISGNAASATKVNNNLIIKANSGTTEGTNLYTFNGSAAKTLNILSGTGLALTTAAGSITIQHSNSVTAGTIGSTAATSGTTIAIPYATYDAQGHITGKGTHNHTISASDLGLSNAMHFIGAATVAITDGSTTDPVISGYSSKKAGDVIIDKDSSYEYVWTAAGKWERLGPDGSYKTVQSAVSSPSASGSTTAFIDTISQNANGQITVTKKNLDTSGTWSGTAAKATSDGSGNNIVNTYATKTAVNKITPGTRNNITVDVTPTALESYCAWDTEQKYGYSATVTISGLTENSLIQNLVMTDTLLKAVAPIATTGANTLTFYTKDATALSGIIYTLVTTEAS